MYLLQMIGRELRHLHLLIVLDRLLTPMPAHGRVHIITLHLRLDTVLASTLVLPALGPANLTAHGVPEPLVNLGMGVDPKNLDALPFNLPKVVNERGLGVGPSDTHIQVGWISHTVNLVLWGQGETQNLALNEKRDIYH